MPLLGYNDKLMNTLIESNWKLGRLLAMVVGVIALIVLASVLSDSLLDGRGGRLVLSGGPRNGFDNPAFAPDSPPTSTLRVLQIFSAILWFSALYYAIRYPKRFIPVLVFTAIVIIILSIYMGDLYRVGSERLEETAPITEVEQEVRVAPPPELVEQPTIPREIPILFWTILGILLIGGALYLSFRLYKYYDFGRDNPDPVPLVDLKQDALEAIYDIESGKNLRNVIEDCYAKMVKRVTESSPTIMKKSATPREFESVLLGLKYPKEAVERLTRLFENSRYGEAEPTERERREALACLQEIANSEAVMPA